MVQLNFDANTVAPTEAFDPIPAGWYKGQIIESEMKPTKAGDGSYLSLTIQVLEGEFNNRRIFTNLNLDNKNPIAVEIAYRTLSAICHATGVVQVQDSQQLHNLPFEFKVSVKPAENGYEAGNDVKGFRPIGNAVPSGQPAFNTPATGPAFTPTSAPQQPPAQQPAQQPPAQQGGGAPWNSQPQQPPAGFNQQPQQQPQQPPNQDQSAPWNQPVENAAPAGPVDSSTPPWQQ